jgi:hypothetical protein
MAPLPMARKVLGLQASPSVCVRQVQHGWSEACPYDDGGQEALRTVFCESVMTSGVSRGPGTPGRSAPVGPPRPDPRRRARRGLPSTMRLLPLDVRGSCRLSAARVCRPSRPPRPAARRSLRAPAGSCVLLLPRLLAAPRPLKPDPSPSLSLRLLLSQSDRGCSRLCRAGDLGRWALCLFLLPLQELANRACGFCETPRLLRDASASARFASCAFTPSLWSTARAPASATEAGVAGVGLRYSAPRRRGAGVAISQPSASAQGVEGFSQGILCWKAGSRGGLRGSPKPRRSAAAGVLGMGMAEFSVEVCVYARKRAPPLQSARSV